MHLRRMPSSTTDRRESNKLQPTSESPLPPERTSYEILLPAAIPMADAASHDRAEMPTPSASGFSRSSCPLWVHRTIRGRLHLLGNSRDLFIVLKMAVGEVGVAVSSLSARRSAGDGLAVYQSPGMICLSPDQLFCWDGVGWRLRC